MVVKYCKFECRGVSRASCLGASSRGVSRASCRGASSRGVSRASCHGASSRGVSRASCRGHAPRPCGCCCKHETCRPRTWHHDSQATYVISTKTGEKGIQGWSGNNHTATNPLGSLQVANIFSEYCMTIPPREAPPSMHGVYLVNQEAKRLYARDSKKDGKFLSGNACSR